MVDFSDAHYQAYAVITDHLGTPRQLRDGNNTTVWQWQGEAFGNTPANEDPDGDGRLVTFNPRFPGQYFDGETGLGYNWNRYYASNIGRYLSSDPLGLDAGNNPFTYVNNIPLKLIDINGLRPCPAGMVPPGVPCCLDDGDGSGSGYPNEGQCGTSECSANILPNPNYTDEQLCKIKCNTLVDMICGPVAGISSETGPVAVGAFLVCRAAVYAGSAKACNEMNCKDR